MSCYSGMGIVFRRAREWHLYDDQGKRYTDFCQDRGRALLGHRPQNLSTVVKNEISRGVWAVVDSPWPHRIHRQLERLFSGVTILKTFFLPEEAAGPGGELEDDLEPEAVVRWWRPLQPEGLRFSGTIDIIAPLIPWSLPGIPQPLCACSAMGLEVLEALQDGTSRYNAVSPVHGAGIGRVLSLLQEDEAISQRLQVAEDLFIPSGYTRSGVYLVPSGMEDVLTRPPRETPVIPPEWNRFRRQALNCGVILPPSPSDPIIVPGELSRSERRQWERVWHES